MDSKTDKASPFTSLLCLIATLLWAGLALAELPGPRDGPSALPTKQVIYIASDFQNGGVSGVYRGFERAARLIGWQVSALNGKGRPEQLRNALREAIALRPDGIVIGGFEARDYGDWLQRARQAGIALVGWHANDRPGPDEWLFTNITTDPKAVADAAAGLVVARGNAGVVLLTDSQFSIATAKTRRMAEVVRRCPGCRVLSIEDVPISSAGELMPALVERLNARFGAAWTHTLAINDIYFDNINMPLARLGRRDILHISAGDGSAKALGRIHSGLSQQLATVAEPLGAHGWQLVDELNRAFAGAPPSSYVANPRLITTEVLRASDTLSIELDPDYEAHYLRIWRP